MSAAAGTEEEEEEQQRRRRRELPEGGGGLSPAADSAATTPSSTAADSDSSGTSIPLVLSTGNGDDDDDDSDLRRPRRKVTATAATPVVDGAVIHETDMAAIQQALTLILAHEVFDVAAGAGHTGVVGRRLLIVPYAAGRGSKLSSSGLAAALKSRFNALYCNADWQCMAAPADSGFRVTRRSLEGYVKGTFIAFSLQGWTFVLYRVL